MGRSSVGREQWLSWVAERLLLRVHSPRSAAPRSLCSRPLVSPGLCAGTSCGRFGVVGLWSWFAPVVKWNKHHEP